MAGGYFAGKDTETLRTQQIDINEQSKQLNAQAIGAGQIKLDQQRQMTEQMKGITIAPGVSGMDAVADQLDQMAIIASRTGNIEAAQNLATKSAQVRETNSKVKTQQLKATTDRWNMASSLLSGVHDDASWRQANQTYAMMTGQQSPYANAPYSPELVDQLKGGVQTAKDRALTEQAEATAVKSKAELPLLKARTEYYYARAAHLGKEGAVKVVTADLKAATDLIEKDYGSINPEDSRIIGRQIVDRTKELLKRNPALTKLQAMNKAYHEKRAAGSFSVYRQKPQKTPKQYMMNGKPMAPGAIVDGYAWTGGDPKDPNSWEQQGEGDSSADGIDPEAEAIE